MCEIGHTIGHCLEVVLSVVKQGKGFVKVFPYVCFSKLVRCGKLVLME